MADQKRGTAIPEGAAVVLTDGRKGTALTGGIWGEYVPIRKTDGRRYTAYWHQIASVDATAPAAPPPPSAAKPPLLGEPTARTLIQRLLAIAPLGELAIVEEARAYLATRAQPEEGALAAMMAWAAIDRAEGASITMAGVEAHDRMIQAALALPVEGRAPAEPVMPEGFCRCGKALWAHPNGGDQTDGHCRAPDASHEKKLGKGGAICGAKHPRLGVSCDFKPHPGDPNHVAHSSGGHVAARWTSEQPGKKGGGS